jgi:hypothetical protein
MHVRASHKIPPIVGVPFGRGSIGHLYTAQLSPSFLGIDSYNFAAGAFSPAVTSFAASSAIAAAVMAP